MIANIEQTLSPTNGQQALMDTPSQRMSPPQAHPQQPARCPIDHSYFSQQKTAPASEPDAPPIVKDGAGVWHVRGYEEAKIILRSLTTKQAGFKAELIELMNDKVSKKMEPAVLYQEGPAHVQQRKQIARFFTPKTTSDKYRQMMQELSDQIVGDLQRSKQADLSKLSMKLAVRVASQVVGLTNSLLPGISRRLDAFFQDAPMNFSWHPRAILKMLQSQFHVTQFFYLDVKPAIRARRKAAQEDVISHLLGLNRSDAEILIECITYGAAGMVTTREFICVAAWHFLEQPELRQRYLNSGEEERYQILHEILRLEPVVGHLQRRATEEIVVPSRGEMIVIAQGELIDIHIHDTNTDSTLVGDQPEQICPTRSLRSEKANAAVMSFGDGAHRCPGAYIAMQESDIFLQRLLRIEGLRLVQPPTVSWGAVTNGYEFRQFWLAVG